MKSSSTLTRLSCLAIAFAVFCGCEQATVETESKRQIGTVELEIDFGGAEKNIAVQIPCSEDSTVFDILRRAEMSGDIELQSSGSGETAFVQAINEVGQQSPEGQYWTYLLNGELSKTGSGVTEVDPGDQLQWRFGAPPEELTE